MRPSRNGGSPQHAGGRSGLSKTGARRPPGSSRTESVERDRYSLRDQLASGPPETERETTDQRQLVKVSSPVSWFVSESNSGEPVIVMSGEEPPRAAQPDTELDLLEGEDGSPSGVQPFEEHLNGGGGGDGGELGFEGTADGRGKKRNKWGRVSSMQPTKPVDIDVYSTKKTVTQGFMDVALLTANADQLRTLVTRSDPESPFRVVCIVFLSISIILQVVIAICLFLKGRYNINKEHHFRRAETVNNVCMIASILLTFFNILASSFAGEISPLPVEEKSKSIFDLFDNNGVTSAPSGSIFNPAIAPAPAAPSL